MTDYKMGIAAWRKAKQSGDVKGLIESGDVLFELLTAPGVQAMIENDIAAGE